MNHVLKITLFILLFCSYALAQGIHIDSLNGEHFPPDEPEDEWVPAYNQLVEEYLFEKPDTALFITEKVLNAIDTLQPSTYLHELYTNKGVALYVKSDFINSYKVHLKALGIAKALNDTTLISRSYNSLGSALSGQNKLSRAQKYHQKAIVAAKSVGNTRGLSRNFLNIGVIQYQQNKYDSAYKYFLRADSATEVIQDREFQALTKAWQGQTLYAQEKLENAEAVFKEALQLPETSLWDKGFIYSGLAQVYIEQGEQEMAIASARKSIEIGERINSQWDLQRAYEVISQAHAEKGQYKLAYEFHKKYKSVSDSLFTMEREKEINYLLLQEEELQNQLLRETAEHQEAQLELSKQIILISALALVLLLVALFFLYKWNREKKALNKQLQEQNESVENQRKEIMEKSERLSDLNEEKDFLIGMVAHDLRSPLSNIKGLIELIKEDDQLSDENKLYLEKIEESEEKMDFLIHRILNIKAIENKELNLEPEELKPAVVLFETADRYSKEAKEKNIHLKKVNREETAKIMADREYLEQIFENLISNAIKFSPPGKQVELKVEESDGKVLTKIIDQGPGISSKDQKQLFLMYNKLAARPTGGESSTGLGLAIVKKFVDGLGARVWCESELGKGSTFVIEFDKLKD